MIYVFHGEDGFSSSEALTPLLDAVGTPDLRDSNVSRLDATEFTIEKFGNAAMVVPFLAERRVVVVYGLLAAPESRRNGRRGRQARAEKEGPAAGLPTLLQELPPTTDTIFMEGKLGSGNPVLASIKKLGPEHVVIREFPLLHRDSLRNWVRSRAAAKGTNIDNPAILELTDLVGPNLWAMDGEIEKLSIYVAGRSITVEDVRALVTSNRAPVIFDLVDAIMDKHPEAALAIMERLLQRGETGQSMITMISRQARMCAIAQEITVLKSPQNEWAQRLGTTSDFVVRKTFEQARRFSPETVRELYHLLLEADIAMKTGETSEELAMTELLAQACALRPTARPGTRPH